MIRYTLTILYVENLSQIAKSNVFLTIKQTFPNITVNERILEISIRNFYNPLRQQINAEKLLKTLIYERKFRNELFLAIINHDIYVPGLNFVFGVASAWQGAIISDYRFLWNADQDLYLLRLKKTVRHELGHVFGLSHCSNECVMRFANSLYELDIKAENFCAECWKKLRRLGVC